MKEDLNRILKTLLATNQGSSWLQIFVGCLGSWPGLKQSPWFWTLTGWGYFPKVCHHVSLVFLFESLFPGRVGRAVNIELKKVPFWKYPTSPTGVAQRPTFRPLKAARSKKLCWALEKRPWSIWTQTPGPEWWRQAGALEQEKPTNRMTPLDYENKTDGGCIIFFPKTHLSLCLGREVYFSRIVFDWPVKPHGWDSRIYILETFSETWVRVGQLQPKRCFTFFVWTQLWLGRIGGIMMWWYQRYNIWSFIGCVCHYFYADWTYALHYWSLC